MNEEPLLDVVAVDGRTLIAAANSNWTRPIPDCPGWDAAALVRHTGGVLAWMAAIVESGERASFRSLPPAPADDAGLSAWFLDNVRRTVGVLRDAAPEREVWTFSTIGEHTVGWWRRRLAVEMAIHRWDAEYAVADQAGAPAPTPLDGNVAAAGIDEFVSEFLPGLLAQQSTPLQAGRLHVAATDGKTAWSLDLSRQGAHVAGDVAPDATVRGTRSDILLWMTNRSTGSVNLDGDRDLLGAWAQLKR